MAKYKQGIINEAYEDTVNIIGKTVECNPEENETKTTVVVVADTKPQTKLEPIQNIHNRSEHEHVTYNTHNLHTSNTTDSVCFIQKVLGDDICVEFKKEVDNKIIIEIKNDVACHSTSFADSATLPKTCVPSDDNAPAVMYAGDEVDNIYPNDCPKMKEDEELRYRFKGAVFRSFNGKTVKQSWNRTSLRSIRHCNQLSEFDGDELTNDSN